MMFRKEERAGPCCTLVALTEGESFDIVLATAPSGLEALRRLVRRWDLLSEGKRRVLLRQILVPDRCKLQDLPAGLEKWEEQVLDLRVFCISSQSHRFLFYSFGFQSVLFQFPVSQILVLQLYTRVLCCSHPDHDTPFQRDTCERFMCKGSDRHQRFVSVGTFACGRSSLRGSGFFTWCHRAKHISWPTPASYD